MCGQIRPGAGRVHGHGDVQDARALDDRRPGIVGDHDRVHELLGPGVLELKRLLVLTRLRADIPTGYWRARTVGARSDRERYLEAQQRRDGGEEVQLGPGKSHIVVAEGRLLVAGSFVRVVGGG